MKSSQTGHCRAGRTAWDHSGAFLGDDSSSVSGVSYISSSYASGSVNPAGGDIKSVKVEIGK